MHAGRKGRKKGTTIHGIAHAERVVLCIAQFPRGEFTTSDLRRALPDMPAAAIGKVLQYKVRVGWLEHTGYGRYRVGGVRIKTALPAGLIADAMWLVLATAPFGKALRSPEILGETETLVARPGIGLRKQVCSNLNRWIGTGHLERTGARGEYAYTIADGLAERPALSRTI